MDAVILCGGRGTRLQEHSRSIPKPLVEVGGRPIVWHVVRLLAAQGLRRFVLATGYRGAQVAAFAAGAEWPPDVVVECVETGLDTPTGGRVHALAARLGETFLLTYADGVADLDVAALLGFHAAHGALATVTVVQPRLPFGVAVLDGSDRVVGFTEKPRAEAWVNGGFFVLEPGVLGRLDAGSVLEREPLERLAAAGELRAYRHDGFWACMDTYKDALELDDLWAAGRAPWRRWS
jgi:glucose-1-phosphate cytidylyltransferase